MAKYVGAPETEPLIRQHSRGSYTDQDDVERNGQDGLVECDSESDSGSDSDGYLKKRRRERLQEVGGWWAYLRDFSVFLPYLSPRGDGTVQACIAACLVSLAGQRVLNVLVPRQLGMITNKLLEGEPPYAELGVWLLLSILNDKAGLGMVQELAKVPIHQFSERRLANAAFAHVMDLSMDFHSERDSAEVMKALDQGGSLMSVMDTLVNDILPTVADLVLAVGILCWKFGVLVALAMLAAVACFLGLEMASSGWNMEPRRQSAKAEREAARVLHQAVQGWTTVCHFNMFRFERARFAQAVDAKLRANRRWSFRNTGIEGLVEVLEPLTFFVLAGLILRAIAGGRAQAGDFVFLIEYWGYLVWPIKLLSHNYRWLMADLIDAERLLALLQTRPTVVDRPGAQDMGRQVQGRVAFEHVTFAYDAGKTATIRDLSFAAAPGQTVALVGATGAGKSTVAKLLLRFYDVAAGGGRITVDGHDIRDVTLDSLRRAIGVVPQTPLLFSGTIMDNVRYAKVDATDDEVFAACRAAAIHDSIVRFADGYATRVGEQGVKLSGGEVQRLAIARVILKQPRILILDEATSAVDTHTESTIQTALDACRREQRWTTLVIAHRLSTIVAADRILVLDQGTLVEAGTHQELLDQNGRYKELWLKQFEAGHAASP